MSRTIKTGLDYFPFDIDFFDDEKIQFISAKFDELGENIAIKLMCRIYRNGYFMKWGQDEALLFSNKAGDNITNDLVINVVKELLKRDFFCEKVFKKYGVLTSTGIQKRFFKATERRKQIDAIKEYLVINVNNFNENVNINPLNSYNGTQSKVKESKGKNTYRENVLLAPKEYECLCSDFGKDVADSKIEDLDNYSGTNSKKFKTYTDHNKVLRSWLKKKGIKKISETKGNNLCKTCKTEPIDRAGLCHGCYDKNEKEHQGEG